MDAGSFERKIRQKLVINLVFPLVVLFFLGLYYFLLSGSGLLSLDGLISPKDVKKSYEMLKFISSNGLLRDTTKITTTFTYADLSDLSYEESVFSGLTLYYHIGFLVGGKYMFCEMSENDLDQFEQEGQFTFAGVLSPIKPELQDFYVKEMAGYGVTEEEALTYLFPYKIVNYTGTLDIIRYIILSPIPALIILMMVLFVRIIICLLDVKFYRGFRKLDSNLPFYTMLALLEQQFGAAEQNRFYHPYPTNTICLTRNFLIIETVWSIKVYLADQLLWAYRAEKYTRVGSKVYLGERSFAVILSKSNTIKVNGIKTKIDELLYGMGEAYPWMQIGYTMDRYGAWETDIARVEERARQKKKSSGFIGVDQ